MKNFKLLKIFKMSIFDYVSKTYLTRLAFVIIQFSSSDHEASSIGFIIQSIICQLLYPGSKPIRMHKMGYNKASRNLL